VQALQRDTGDVQTAMQAAAQAQVLCATDHDSSSN